MSNPIVLEKSAIDISLDGITLTVADDEATNTGQSFVEYIRDRKNTSGWATTGSSDTATCSLIAELASGLDINSVLLIDHNFKDYDLSYWDGIQWVSIESVTGNTATSSYHFFTQAVVYKIKIEINATQIVDDDKFLAQLVITDYLSNGVFVGSPIIKNLKHKTAKKVNTVLSGKALVTEGEGAAEFSLSFKITSNDNDLTLIEAMYSRNEGFLVCLSGDDETQFSTLRKGYRRKDVYFMRMIDDYNDDFFKGVYVIGTVIKCKLREAIS